MSRGTPSNYLTDIVLDLVDDVRRIQQAVGIKSIPVIGRTIGSLSTGGASAEPRVVDWEQPGTVHVDHSGPYDFLQGFNLRRLVVRLGTAGTSTTTVVAKKNGTTILTCSLASGATFNMVRLDTASFYRPRIDVMTVEVTAAGTGALDLIALTEE